MFQVPFYPAIDETKPNLFREETVSSVVEYAKTKPPGVHKLQIQNYPISFAEITVNDEKLVSLHMVNGAKDPNYPADLKESINLGYCWYLEKHGSSEDKLSKAKFKQLQGAVCNKIDKCIEGHHGVLCCMEVLSRDDIKVEARNDCNPFLLTLFI